MFNINEYNDLEKILNGKKFDKLLEILNINYGDFDCSKLKLIGNGIYGSVYEIDNNTCVKINYIKSKFKKIFYYMNYL